MYFTPTDVLLIITTLAIFCILSSFAVLGVFLAANHKFFEDGQQKKLILVSFKESLDTLYKKMDNIRFLVALKNWLSLLIGLGAVILSIYLSIKTKDVNYLGLSFLIIAWLGFGKSFESLGVMFLGCYRCMSTGLIALPVIISGTILGFMHNSIFFWGKIGRAHV